MTGTKPEEKKTQKQDDSIVISFDEVTKNYDNLLLVVDSMKPDYTNFITNNNKAAGVRMRGSLLASKKICDSTRKEILATIKSIPVKHRPAKLKIEDTEEKIEEPEKLKPIVRSSEEDELDKLSTAAVEEKICKKAQDVISETVKK